MHKKEMKTTYCPSAGITRIRFWGRPRIFSRTHSVGSL